MERPGRHLTVGLVLSGGGARGFAHIGVLRVLEREGARYDVIAGTSMGAIIGALYAAGHRPDKIQEITATTTWRDVVDLSLRSGLMKGDRLHDLLEAHLPATFEELEIPLAIISTDIESGEEVVHTEGDLITAVRASAGFPGAFEPVYMDGRTLGDGGIVNNLPVSAALLMGANRTIASDVTPPRQAIYRSDEGKGNWWERWVATVKLERRTPMVQMLFRSTDIQQSILVDIRAAIHPADLRIRMDMPQYRIESFAEFEAIIEEGEKAAERTLSAVGGWRKVLALEEDREPEQVAAAKRSTGHRTAAQRASDKRATDKRAADQKTADRKPADNKPADQPAASPAAEEPLSPLAKVAKLAGSIKRHNQ